MAAMVCKHAEEFVLTLRGLKSLLSKDNINYSSRLAISNDIFSEVKSHSTYVLENTES